MLSLLVTGATTLLIRPHLAAVSSRQSTRAATVRSCQAEGDDGLAGDFAAELRKRQAALANPTSEPANPVSEAPQRESYTGIREIVVGKDGVPTSIPRRPPPPPASTMGDEVRDLLISPSFALGVLIAVGSLVLILAIAASDAGA